MRPRATSDVPSTPPFDFIFGRYQLSRWKIPYLFTTMKLVDAASSLRLVTEFPGAERLNWKIEELYQRDIDWPRVERKILPYLSDPEQPQFFNALTIALLPIRGGEATLDFSRDGWSRPEPDLDDYEKNVGIGPVTVSYWQDWGSVDEAGARIGKVRWNPTQVFSVAIDGQHRLAAIKSLVERHGFDSRLSQTQIPVILVLFAPEVGYEAGVPDAPIVDVLRMLFIDLNKHAQKVSRSRLILLDDKDPHSMCVRSLIGRELSPGLTGLDETPPRLPLNLVDWHTEQARYDEGPYLATVLGLDWIVTTVLGVKPLEDYMDYSRIQSQINAFETSLRIDLGSAKRRLQDLENIKLMPFSYSDTPGSDELAVIVAAFERIWNPALVHILTKFIPYEALVRERQAKSTLQPEFISWYYAYFRRGGRNRIYEGKVADEYGKLVHRLATRTPDPISEDSLLNKLTELEQVKKNNLAFNVVFQRALFRAFVEFEKIKPEHVDEARPSWTESDDDMFDIDDVLSDESDLEAFEASAVSEDAVEYEAQHVLRRAEQFVKALNEVISSRPEFLDVHSCAVEVEDDSHPFWMGSLLSPAGTIDFTLGASTRASDVIFWAAALWLLKNTDEDLSDFDFDELWEHVTTTDKPVYNRLRRSLRRYYQNQPSAAAYRILRARDEEYDEDAAIMECCSRLLWIWEALD